jgi:ribosome assembly protein 1
VAHVCKFVSTDPSHIRDPEISVNPDEKTHLILGVARVLSGTLRTNDSYYWMGPKHSYGATAAAAEPKRKIRLYLLMGSSFVRVDEVPAGHLCAIFGLEELQLKTVTLCDSPDGMPLQGFDRRIRPLVKVNVEPVNASESDVLERGLVKLSLADAAVEVTATAKGERILACLGEIHLEQSILDLEKIYCGKQIALRISDPIVEFGETTDWFENETSDYAAFFAERNAAPARQTTIPPYNEEEGIRFAYRGRTRTIVSGRVAAVGLRAVPLAKLVHDCLQQKKIIEGSEHEIVLLGRALGLPDDVTQSAEAVLTVLLETLCSLDSSGNAILAAKGLTYGATVKGVIDDEVYVPPRSKEEENDDTEPTPGEEAYKHIISSIGTCGLSAADNESNSEEDKAALELWTSKMRGSAVAGFQMAVRSGALCEEPIRGVLVVLESFEVALQADGDGFTSSKTLSGGMVVAALRQGIRCALLSRPARLVEGHLKLTLHSTLAGLGSLYAVLTRRRGKVLEDSMVEGTDLLLITATLPQAESFRLTPELLAKTSGEVTVPELTFLKWERLDEDPFWIPTSLEEREDFGEIVVNGDISTGVDNTALTYIRKVRDRKGLLVDSSRTVIAAEKQRTLKK